MTLHEVKEMMTGIPWWEICLGASNLVLAGVVAWSSWSSSKKDRKVHIADKRMEWITDFRNTVSELLAFAYLAMPPRASGVRAEEVLERFAAFRNKISLMGLSPEGFVGEGDFMRDIHMLNDFVFHGPTAGIRTNASFDDLRIRIINKSQEIINEKWQKIRNLDD
ncbi:MAG: hypothetical protein AAF575_00015 [Bacteroidota bacterium]